MIESPAETSAKHEAVRQWTSDPCGPDIDAVPGTAAAIEQLLEGRRAYAPWFPTALAYNSTIGLDVLDVGCGQGIDVVEYARAGARVTGIDLTPRHVELARAHTAALGLDVRILSGDAEQLPFADASFDRVSSNGVLHHTPDMPAALREICRVLRPGGEARILVYNRRSFHYLLSQLLLEGVVNRRLFREGSMEAVLSANVERTSIGARPLVRVYSPAKVRRMLRSAGFTGVHTAVGGFNVEDTPVSALIARHTRLLDSRVVLDRLGSIGGWYVLGIGRRPR
jgi:ubiquinone/menaquinone biosynthesis C-methylase UbiE